MRGEGLERLGAGLTIGIEAADTVMVDDGPLRKTIEYRVPGKTATLLSVTMDAGSRPLRFESAGGNRCWVRWQPGLGLDPVADAFVWPSKAGVRKIAFSFEDQDGADLTRDFAEGWYAFTDGATGQAVGELFEPRQCFGFKWMAYGATSALGYATYTSASGRRALVALPDGYGVERLRQEYLTFKNPPQVALGAAQERERCPATPVAPVWGKSFIAFSHVGLMMGRNAFAIPWRGNFPAYWDEVMPKLQERGLNGVGLFPYRWDVFASNPSFTQLFLEKAKEHGLANYVFTPWTPAAVSPGLTPTCNMAGSSPRTPIPSSTRRKSRRSWRRPPLGSPRPDPEPICSWTRPATRCCRATGRRSGKLMAWSRPGQRRPPWRNRRNTTRRCS